MPGSWLPSDLPNLTDANCEITSRATRHYNCIAWVAADDTRNWWPDQRGIGYWPADAPRVETVAAFIGAFDTLGYKPCLSAAFEEGIEKIALYAIEDRDLQTAPTHAARQLESGEWTSKLGQCEDVRHPTPDSVSGPLYCKPACYMSRARRKP
jgi:hypothetical protein